MKLNRWLFILLCFFWTITTSAKEVGLKEKIGQMLVIGFEGVTLKPNDPIIQAISSQQIGGVILFDYNFKTQTFDRNIQSPQQLKQLTGDLQRYAIDAAKIHQNNLYPLLVSIDYEGGERGTRLKESHGFPKTLPAAELGKLSKKEVQVYAEQMSDTLKQAGVNLNFAPVLDVNVNPDNPVIGKIKRSFSNDPEKVAKYAAIFSKTYEDHGILCAYKHFPGHGSSTGDTHEGFVDVTQTWKALELEPYKKLLNQSNGCQGVMVAHVVHSGLDAKGLPSSLSSEIIQKLLRKQLNFEGVVITDDMQMKAIIDHYGLPDALRLAVNAGADILVFGNQLVAAPQNPQEVIEIIYQDVKAGRIPESRIQAAYERIMKLKNSLRVKHQ